MLTQTPRHAVQVFWRKHRPDEQVSPQRRAGRHDKEKTSADEDSMKSEMVKQKILLPVSMFLEHEEIGS